MPPLKPFADYLRNHEQELIERWIELSRDDKSFRWARTLNREQFEDGIPAVLKELEDYLEAPPDTPASSLAMENVMDHGQDRWKLGFNLTGLLRDWGNLRETLVEAVDGYFEDPSGDSTGDRMFAHRRVSRFFTEASCASVERFDEVRRVEASSLSEDLRKMRRHFARLQQLRSELLHEASHDIRSGLTAISGISGVLAGKPDGDQREQLAGIINESVSSVVEILDSLMELNRLEAGKETVAAERFDLAAHLRSLGESFRQVAEGKGLELEIDGDREILISSDPGKLRRIVQNLLVNAIKYTKQGSVSLLWKRGMHHCEVRIIDTGPGLRAKHGLQVLEELADQNTPEATPDEEDAGVLSYEGEGIGLTIVKRLCSLLRIPIDLQSGAGRGTTFVLYIPNDLKPEIVPDEPDS